MSRAEKTPLISRPVGLHRLRYSQWSCHTMEAYLKGDATGMRFISNGLVTVPSSHQGGRPASPLQGQLPPCRRPAALSPRPGKMSETEGTVRREKIGSSMARPHPTPMRNMSSSRACGDTDVHRTQSNMRLCTRSHSYLPPSILIHFAPFPRKPPQEMNTAGHQRRTVVSACLVRVFPPASVASFQRYHHPPAAACRSHLANACANPRIVLRREVKPVLWKLTYACQCHYHFYQLALPMLKACCDWITWQLRAPRSRRHSASSVQISALCPLCLSDLVLGGIVPTPCALAHMIPPPQSLTNTRTSTSAGLESRLMAKCAGCRV